MIDIRITLRNLLAADAAVAALVGSRIYPALLPQGIRLPSVVYSHVSGRTEYVLAGSGNLIEDTWQVDGIAPDPDTAAAIGLAVHGALSGRSGDFTPNGIVRGIFRNNTRDLYDSNTQLHRASSDFVVWYREN